MATKLLIGNIESNPFPSDLREFLGFLFTDAEDTNIKDVLNDFKAANDRPTNLKKMKSKKVEHLKSTLAYLNDWSKDDSLIKEEIDAYTKDGIALLVVNKVYNMAPEQCSSCSKSYYFKPGEYCALTCIRCDRGACPVCYEKEKANLSSSCMFNKNIFFSCIPCSEIIRKEAKFADQHKKKSASKKVSKDPANGTNEETEPETITLEENTTVDDLVDALDNLSVNSQSENQTKVPEGRKPEQDQAQNKSKDLPEGRKEKASQNKEISNCYFYQKNVCKYGISGKGCKFFHQKPCNKLLTHGDDRRYGCTKNNSCKYFHPSMCKYSLETRVCTNLKCGYFHVKGTKRSKPVKDVKNKTSEKPTSKCTSSTTLTSGEKPGQENPNFLVKGQARSKPPLSTQLEHGTGYGEDIKNLMNTVNQLLQIQNHQTQQIQLLTQRNLPAFQTQLQLPQLQVPQLQVPHVTHLPAFQNVMMQNPNQNL